MDATAEGAPARWGPLRFDNSVSNCPAHTIIASEHCRLPLDRRQIFRFLFSLPVLKVISLVALKIN